MKDFKGRKVLITGAARGIGYCTAENFARVGAELIITDIDDAPLEEVAHKLRGFGVPVHTRVVDVADRQQVEELNRWVTRQVGPVDILINNAGIGCIGELRDTGVDTWKRLMDVNFWGPLYHVYSFLPSMIERCQGHIVNVSSGQAFFRLPTWGAYAISKLALGAFSEILGFELKKFNIGVTTVYPFMTNTGFYQDMRSESPGQRLAMKLLPFYSMTPEKVGRIIFRAIQKRKAIEMVSLMNQLGFYSRFAQTVSNVISTVAVRLLGKSDVTTMK